MLGVPSTALQRLFPNCGRVHPKVMSQCVTRTEQIHPGNKPTNPPRGIHSTFQTRDPGKTGQMPWAYQISKLYKVHSLFRNFKFKQAFPVRVRWLPADLKYQKPEQNTKQRYTQVCTNYIHSCVFSYVESSWRHAMWWKQFSITIEQQFGIPPSAQTRQHLLCFLQQSAVAERNFLNCVGAKHLVEDFLLQEHSA